jgi:sortase (surface protein transpeptidase)
MQADFVRRVAGVTVLAAGVWVAGCAALPQSLTDNLVATATPVSSATLATATAVTTVPTPKVPAPTVPPGVTPAAAGDCGDACLAASGGAFPSILPIRVGPSSRPDVTSVATPKVAAPVALTPTPSTSPSDSGRPVPTGYGPFPLPLRVRIPRIKVNAPIQAVGVNPDGTMSAPPSPGVVAWYGYGAPPGEPGASVLAGHVDSVRGPAVFWSLQDLQAGDPIDIDLVGGVTLRFVVVQTAWYVPAAAPLATIFGTGGDPRLNLITCGGVFDHALHAYDKRLVVFTRFDSTMAGVKQ